MSTESEKDLIRSKRATRAALVFAFLLAFFWPLGNFFFWIFSGATAYCIFLALYYRPQPKREPRFRSYTSSRQSNASANATSSPEEAKKKARFIIFLLSGLILVIAVASSLTEEATENTPAEDSSPLEETNDRAILQSDPNDVNALTNVGNHYYAQQQYDSALIHYERALQVDPQNTVCLYNKALVFYQKQNFMESLEWAKRCLSSDPEYNEARVLIGDCYYEQRNWNEALTRYNQAYDKGANNPELLNVMGYCYEQVGRQGEAIRFYKETLQKDSSFADVYARLAELEPSHAARYKKLAENWKK